MPRKVCIMKKQERKELRLYGKELYIIYPKLGVDHGNLRAEGFTNKNQMDGHYGLTYDNLVRVFTRKKYNKGKINYYEFKDAIVIRLYLSDVTKGGQSVKRKGRGGRDEFNKFIKEKS